MNRLFAALLSLRVASILFCMSPLAPYFSNINDGFAVGKVLAPLPPAPFVAPSEEVCQALSQPYRYLGKGAQSYAFVSADGAYVLKLFKQQHLTPCPYLPRSWQSNSCQRKRQRMTSLFESYRLAFEELAQETGVLYAHLGTTAHLQQKADLVDIMRHRHVLDLDEVAFVLQRRAIPISEALDSLFVAQRTDEAKTLAQSAYRTTLRRCQKGYIDTDPAFLQNYGVTADGAVIQIDVGRVMKAESAISAEERAFVETAQLRQYCLANGHFEL